MTDKTCSFCGTVPNASDPTVCRSRDQASACAWAAGRLKPDGMSEADRMAAALDRITMLRAFQGARRLAKRNRDRNWVFATEMFGLGSTYAWGMCVRMGIDPDAFSADPLPAPATPQDGEAP